MSLDTVKAGAVTCLHYYLIFPSHRNGDWDNDGDWNRGAEY